VAINQRGSLLLENEVLETSFQGLASPFTAGLNCFTCHNYSGTTLGKRNTAFAADLSHIFDDVILGQCMDEASSTLINEDAAL